MKRSLHIGLNLVNAENYNGWPGYLDGCVADCAILAPILARAGFNSTPLLNERATLRGVDEAVLKLANDSKPGDTALIHYSGHGGRQDWGVLGGYHETLCLFDGELLDMQFRQLLARFAPDVNVVVLLDSCHSGGMDRGSRGVIKARPAFVRGTAPELHRGDAPVVANVGLMTACLPGETASEQTMPAIDRVMGAFTFSVVEHIEDCSTWLSLFASVSRFCAERFPRQHPFLHRLGKFPDKALEARIA